MISYYKSRHHQIRNLKIWWDRDTKFRVISRKTFLISFVFPILWIYVVEAPGCHQMPKVKEAMTCGLTYNPVWGAGTASPLGGTACSSARRLSLHLPIPVHELSFQREVRRYSCTSCDAHSTELNSEHMSTIGSPSIRRYRLGVSGKRRLKPTM